MRMLNHPLVAPFSRTVRLPNFEPTDGSFKCTARECGATMTLPCDPNDSRRGSQSLDPPYG